MKRVAICSVLLLGLLVSPIPVASAASDGCPINWSIDKTSNAGYLELVAAKEKLQGNMVLEPGKFEFSNFSGEIGPMLPPAENLINASFPQIGLPDLYLYGDTLVFRNYSVQVKNCSEKTNFLIKKGTLKDVYGLSTLPTFISISAKDWATTNSFKFKDFVAANNFSACLNAMQQTFTHPRSSFNNKTNYPYLFMGVGLFRNSDNSCGFMQSSSPAFSKVYSDYLILLELTPGCAWPNGIREGVSVPSEKVCEFAVGIVTDKWAPIDVMRINEDTKISGPIYLLESFKVSGTASPKLITITCTKGKLAKKVSGTNPKCPKGYVKK